MSNVGKWQSWYGDLPKDQKPLSYGDSPAYELGAEWLKDCSLVEDWGCGLGWMRTLINGIRYRGIDGTASPFCDEVVDLATYHSKVPGIFMRGVIEHNFNWDIILMNALTSFTERMCLVIFTPTDEVTKQVAFVEEIGVPDMAIALDDLITVICSVDEITTCVYEMVEVGHGYNEETVFYLERDSG